MPGYRGKSSTLAITATPFKSSRLAIPPSPFSPRTPLAIQLTLNFSSKFSQASAIYAAPAPPSPLSWLWQCHQCHQSYQLGVTRRCLDDGHHFCAGTTTVKTRRASTAQRQKRHKACASEFDYQGWKAWGRWKRTGLHHDKAHYTNAQTRNKKDCWNTCNYPSECRWGKQFGIHSPVEPDFPTVQSAEEPVGPGGVLKPESASQSSVKRGDGGDYTWTALVASAKRRKGNGLSCPPADTVVDGESTGGEKVGLERVRSQDSGYCSSVDTVQNSGT